MNKSSSSLPSESENSTIVRVAGHGQFKVSKSTINKINDIDNQIVDILNKDTNNNDNNSKIADEKEFRRKMTEMVNLITTEGKPLDNKELIESHIIVPTADLSIEEAKKIFKDEGIIPES
jgi:PspAA-like protein